MLFSRLIILKKSLPVILSFLLWNTISAQKKENKFDASILLQFNDSSSKKMQQGGVYYEGEELTAKLVMNDNHWDGVSRYYCYVVTYNENEPYFFLLYPGLPDDNTTNKFPQKTADNKFTKEITLFDFEVTAPFGKDNIVLIMTENPISNYHSLFNYSSDKNIPLRGETSYNKEELLKFLKGSKLSSYYKPEFGEVIIKTTQAETRPRNEKKGLLYGGNSGVRPTEKQKESIFVFDDSSEIFYTPTPQEDIVRDNFPTVDILDPHFDTATTKGLKVLQNANGRKLLIRCIAVDWQRGIKKITINNNPPATFHEASGYFDYLHELINGTNIVDVSIENNQGYKRTTRLKFQYTAKTDKVTHEEIDYLLVIGINNYKNWPVLHNATKDARDFEQLMLGEFGYKKENVIELYDEDATRKNIYSQLKKFVDNLNENDRLLIYYSGHGFYDDKLELGYWIPVNAESNEYDECLNNLDITRFIEKMKAKNIFIIADACYSGSLLRDLQKENSKDYKSRMVLCSGKLQPVPDGNPGTNSPFAAEVLQFLRKTREPRVLASDLIDYVKKSFHATDKQKPVGGAVDEVGDENGDFIFEKKK